MKETLFALGDADDVGKHLERQLLDGNLDQLSRLSACLSLGINRLASAMENHMSAEIIMAGGDDVLFRIDTKRFSEEKLHEISRQFQEETGCTISFGIGSDTDVAYLNLRRAKASGGGIAVISDRWKS